MKQQLQLRCINLTRLAFFTIPLLLFFAFALFLHACLATQLTTFLQSKSATHSWPPFSHPQSATQGKIWKLPSWTRFTAEGGRSSKMGCQKPSMFHLPNCQGKTSSLAQKPRCPRCTHCTIHLMFCTGYTTFPDSVSQ